jgi:hypothetical protein
MQEAAKPRAVAGLKDRVSEGVLQSTAPENESFFSPGSRGP